ncbi:MAG: hypothetical protein EXR98_17075 [Gemmataceae bacterium]|nr:hypothetical protein [Gemmataceae bacterium]
MASPAQSVQRSFAAGVLLACRRLLCCAVVILCALVVVQAVAVEAFHVPTGSMAPALLGHHRVCVCPRCGQEVAIGRNAFDKDGTGESRYYRKAFCPNCGNHPLSLTKAAEVPGDALTVDRTAYLRREPSRWEIIVFRLLGHLYIKRLLALPGEEICIRDGDVYVNGRLCRKTLEEARRMRVLVFEHDKAPKDGWTDRWEHESAVQARESVSLLALRAPNTLTYRNYSLDARKCEPLRDEYAYNGGLHADSECVHDFSIETEIEISAGRGSLSLRLCDGQGWVEVLIPVGKRRPVEALAWGMETPVQVQKIAATQKTAALRVGSRYRIELAFVDRRLSLAVDGQHWLSVDLPEAGQRQGVPRPFQAQADGVHVQFHRFRLYRDVHYSQHGRNAVHGKSVHLGTDQYFMLGDNSANSEDSRYWADEGRVSGKELIGPVLQSQQTRP